MDEEFATIIKQYVPSTNATQATNALSSYEKLFKILLQHKKIPNEGWNDVMIETFLQRLSLMDTNNFLSKASVGEREAHIASTIVQRRHFNFGHGIGRSGDLNEIQPKATGSSVIYNLTNALITDLFASIGVHQHVFSVLVPVCTGMGLVLSMLALKCNRPKAKYVIWSRIDQKSCFKSIITAGFIPIIIDTVQQGDYLGTNLNDIKIEISQRDSNEILCVMTTTSCFAPRVCDDVEGVAELCKMNKIPHLVNNAYGMQSKSLLKRIEKASKKGRVDYFVQSTDKNLMVPVGGVIIASFDPELITNLAKLYPGRASISPILDVLITLLSLGKMGYAQKLVERENHFQRLQEGIQKFVASHDEKLLSTPENPISMAFTCNKLSKEATKLGAMLYIRNVFGAKVASPGEKKIISNYEFRNWGTHCSTYPNHYVTVAASIGMNDNDINLFLNRLFKCYK